MNQDVVDTLKQRFDNIAIMLDNDRPGRLDAEKLSKSTGFTNIVLPEFSWGKDISDYYKGLEDKNVFKETIESLIKTSII